MMAALGHPITDVDTGEIIPIFDGQAVETTVSSVTKSTVSETGSISCEFSNKEIGVLNINTRQYLRQIQQQGRSVRLQ